jgi:hypothetical protein
MIFGPAQNIEDKRNISSGTDPSAAFTVDPTNGEQQAQLRSALRCRVELAGGLFTTNCCVAFTLGVEESPASPKAAMASGANARSIAA